MRARKMSCRPRKPHFLWMKLCKGISCPQKSPILWMRARKMSCRPRKPHFLWMKLCKGRSCPQNSPVLWMRMRKMPWCPQKSHILWTRTVEMTALVKSATKSELLRTQSFSFDKMSLLVINSKNGYTFMRNNIVHRGILKSTTRYRMSYLYRVLFYLYGYEKRF